MRIARRAGGQRMAAHASLLTAPESMAHRRRLETMPMFRAVTGLSKWLSLTTPSPVRTAAMRACFRRQKMKHQRAQARLAADAGTLGLFRPFCEESPRYLGIASLGAQSSDTRFVAIRLSVLVLGTYPPQQLNMLSYKPGVNTLVCPFNQFRPRPGAEDSQPRDGSCPDINVSWYPTSDVSMRMDYINNSALSSTIPAPYVFLVNIVLQSMPHKSLFSKCKPLAVLGHGQDEPPRRSRTLRRQIKPNTKQPHKRTLSLTMVHDSLDEAGRRVMWAVLPVNNSSPSPGHRKNTKRDQGTLVDSSISAVATRQTFFMLAA
ncbi:hypothetical protein PMIN01_11644 [Paraphaeosphaeria minitans]|uniref:Uncharacterized protein n=1 Tax=Paraphaeosphaeria minitans TaxID=565426 RepID=A0A9P6GAE9_9PLEO|nr:hypothetical protein PMIN01_11644 [Paraphaeosphaeria minitans]